MASAEKILKISLSLSLSLSLSFSHTHTLTNTHCAHLPDYCSRFFPGKCDFLIFWEMRCVQRLITVMPHEAI